LIGKKGKKKTRVFGPAKKKKKKEKKKGGGRPRPERVPLSCAIKETEGEKGGGQAKSLRRK